ncbi:MAG: hypothetical protein LBI37_03070, partial [Puniceicoccales bacterium]|nr:hypothetical protein [Puniceicoccales bacterium]
AILFKYGLVNKSNVIVKVLAMFFGGDWNVDFCRHHTGNDETNGSTSNREKLRRLLGKRKN